MFNVVFVTKKEKIKITKVDINKRLYSQFSEDLIEVIECNEYGNFVYVKIKSGILQDENSLVLLWDYALSNLIKMDEIIII
jgi:hypothetical protein